MGGDHIRTRKKRQAEGCRLSTVIRFSLIVSAVTLGKSRQTEQTRAEQPDGSWYWYGCRWLQRGIDETFTAATGKTLHVYANTQFTCNHSHQSVSVCDTCKQVEQNTQ
jgi:hypothetical protein